MYPPTPFTHHPQTPFFSFFFSCDMLTEGEAMQFTSLPKQGNVRKGTHIKTMLSWRYSTVQKLQTNTYKHLRYIQYTHTSFCAHPKKYIYFLPLLFVFWINNIWTVKGRKMAFCLVMFFSTLNRSPPLIYFGEYDFKNDKIYKEYQE